MPTSSTVPFHPGLKLLESSRTLPSSIPLFISGDHFINQNPSSAALRHHRRGREHEMVGLSVILETSKDQTETRNPQVVSKGTMLKPPPSPISPSSFSVVSRTTALLNLSTCGFLERCFLCRQKLLPGKDIYMYKGDKAFCSEECRCRQIFMDEEEASATAMSGCTREYNCSFAATTSASSSSSSSAAFSSGKGPRNRANVFVF